MPLNAVCFFARFAGYSYDPKTQTPEEGRKESARRLADVETLYLDAVRCADVGIEWENDPEGFADFSADVRAGHRNRKNKPQQIERAVIWHRDEAGTIHYLASLCGIEDATPSYRRVIRAELAMECADQLRAIIEGAE